MYINTINSLITEIFSNIVDKNKKLLMVFYSLKVTMFYIQMCVSILC